MKKISIIIAVVLSSLLVVQAAGLAKTCASVKGVTAVTITKEMLKLASMVSDRAPVDVMGLVDKLNQVELVSAPAADERRQVLRFVSSYLDENKGYKEIVSITDDDETINLYSKKVSTGLAMQLQRR